MSDFSKLPYYQCHKVVQAGRIVGRTATVSAGKWVVERVQVGYDNQDHFFMVDVPEEDQLHFGKLVELEPSAVSYFVLYDNGHMSWSPAKAFEEGYALKDVPPYIIDLPADKLERWREMLGLSEPEAPVAVDQEAALETDLLVRRRVGNGIPHEEAPLEAVTPTFPSLIEHVVVGVTTTAGGLLELLFKLHRSTMWPDTTRELTDHSSEYGARSVSQAASMLRVLAGAVLELVFPEENLRPQLKHFELTPGVLTVYFASGRHIRILVSP